LSGKLRNKRELQAELGLPAADVPVISVIHRLVAQKGLDVVIEAFDRMMAMGVQFILLGIGDPRLEKTFTELMRKYPEQVSVRIEFNENLHTGFIQEAIFFLCRPGLSRADWDR